MPSPPPPPPPPPSCPDRPAFHVLPPSGWVNDPNGLVWAGGRLHAFYQLVEAAPAWAWGGLSWGHASTADLAAWRHEPVALRPTPGGTDAAGCWSGCCVPAAEQQGGGGGGGAPFTILYTGVALRPGGPAAANPAHCKGDHHPPLPPSTDLGLEQHECQLAAVLVADGGGGGEEEGGGGGGGGAAAAAAAHSLARWAKARAPIIPHAPPPAAGLAGFRDPFVFQRWAGGGAAAAAAAAAVRPWRLVLGCGRKGGRGRLLCYASTHPDPAAPAWVCEGELCDGDGVGVASPEEDAAAGAAAPDAVDVGEMWECPFLAHLEVGAAGAAAGVPRPSTTTTTHTLICVSPYPHTHAVGRPANPPIFWIGPAEKKGGSGDDNSSAAPPRLDLAAAPVGPRRLDLGDILYAPTIAAGSPPDGLAAGGGVVMMGWLQDLRPPGGPASRSPPRNYAGCLSLPRLLRLKAGPDGLPFLHQAPVPGALEKLRMSPPAPVPAWRADTALEPGAAPRPVPGAAGTAVDLELLLEKPAAASTTHARTGLWLRPWLADAGDDPGGGGRPTAVALVLDWATARLEVLHFTRLTAAGCPDWASVARRVGGSCAAAAGGAVALRVVGDASVIEAFCGGSGEALATRVYDCCGPGLPPADAPRRWSLFADGEGPAPVPAARGWAVRGGWENM